VPFFKSKCFLFDDLLRPRKGIDPLPVSLPHLLVQLIEKEHIDTIPAGDSGVQIAWNSEIQDEERLDAGTEHRK
jgi:hypothetical protein